jgi:hypothetical protein
MSTVSAITSFLGPILQHPLFNVVCFIIALLTISILGFFFWKSRMKTRDALKKKELVSDSHPWTSAVAILFFLSLSFGIMASITDWNRPGKITVLDDGKVITDSKLYVSVGRKPQAVYDQTQIYSPSSQPRQKEEPVKMEFKDFGYAETDYEFKMELPQEPEKIKEIHENYGNQNKLVNEGVKPFIAEALKIGAILLSAQETSADKEKKLYAFVKDQLKEGHYVIEEGQIKTDEEGLAIRQKNPLTRLKIKLSGFKLENFKYDELLEQLDKEKGKLIIELKRIENLDFEKLPFLDDIQREIEKHVLDSKKLTNPQKKLINESISSVRQLIIDLKKRDNKEKKDPKK